MFKHIIIYYWMHQKHLSDILRRANRYYCKVRIIIKTSKYTYLQIGQNWQHNSCFTNSYNLLSLIVNNTSFKKAKSAGVYTFKNFSIHDIVNYKSYFSSTKTFINQLLTVYCFTLQTFIRKIIFVVIGLTNTYLIWGILALFEI